MSYMKKLVVDNNKHQEEKRIRRKKMARGPAVCAKKLTLETDVCGFFSLENLICISETWMSCIKVCSFVFFSLWFVPK